MPTTTPRQALPVPVGTDDPDIPRDLLALATAIEKRLFGVYADAADRDTKNPTPEEGQVAYLKGNDTIWFYDATTWKQMYPLAGYPTITSGTTAPNNASGNDGDVYFQV